MKSIFVLLGFLLAFCFVSAPQAAEYHFGVDVVSGHVWRGQELGSATALSVQPSAALTTGGLSLRAHAHSFVQDRDVLGGIGEVRVTAAHAFSIHQARLSVGVHQEFYAHSDGEDTATETFFGLNLPAPLSPKITVGYNFSDLERWQYDWYVALAASTQIHSVDLVASLGLSDQGGWLDFHDVEIRASRTFPLRHTDVSPHVRFSFSDRDTHYWVVGVAFTLK